MSVTQGLWRCSFDHKCVTRTIHRPAYSGRVTEGTPRRVRTAAGIVGAEAATVFALGVAELVRIDTGRPVVGATTGMFFVVYAAGLAAAAVGLARLRSWSRALIVLAQLIQLGVAWSFAGAATLWVAALLAVAAVIVLSVVLAPATTDALYGRPGGDDEDAVSPS